MSNVPTCKQEART